MSIEGPDSNLHKPDRKPVFHDACKGRRMRSRIAFKIVVKIRVSVHMEYGDLPIMRVNGLKHRIGHRMITSQQDGDRLLLQGRSDSLTDQIVITGTFSQGKVTLVDNLKIAANFQAVLTRCIAAIAPQCIPYQGRGKGGPTHERTVAIGWQANEVKHGVHQHIFAALADKRNRYRP